LRGGQWSVIVPTLRFGKTLELTRCKVRVAGCGLRGGQWSVVGGQWSVVGDCSYAALRKNTRTDKVQGAGSKVEGFVLQGEEGREKKKVRAGVPDLFGYFS